jgi:hypothetical protein
MPFTAGGRRRVLWYTFGLALAVRVALILASPRVNYQNTDFEIYREGGRLVSAGINPYDPGDGVRLRQTLREQSVSPTLRITGDLRMTPQEWWDYIVVANPPLSLLFYGAIDMVSHHPIWWRLVFAVMDSSCAALVMFVVLRHWPDAGPREAVAFGFALCAGSLVMLQWGTHSPQDKGTELLLMAGALAASLSERRRYWLFAASILVGLAVAFKILGVFLIPYGLYRIARQQRPNRLRDMAIFCGIVMAVTAATYVPYLPQAISTMTTRLANDIIVRPTHASPLIWVGSSAGTLAAYSQLAQRAQVVRVIAGTVLLVTLATGLMRRSISPEAATASLLVTFVTLVLLSGSLDRMNIGFVMAILLIGMLYRVARWVATALYVALGTVSITLGFSLSLIEERAESIIVAAGCVMLFGWLIGLASGLVGGIAPAALAPVAGTAHGSHSIE